MSTTLVNFLHDGLSFFGDLMVTTNGQDPLGYLQAFRQLHEIFPLKEVHYGEVYNRSMIANVLVILARATPRAEEDIQPLEQEGLFYSPFHSWKEEDWDIFAEYLNAIAANLKRRDASAAVPKDAEDASTVPEISNHELFTTRLGKIHRYIKLYRALCPIRGKLTDQLENEEIDDDDYPKIHKKTVEKLWKTASGEDDEGVRDYLMRGLFEEKKEHEKKSAVPSLRTIGELREVFNSKPFTLDSFGPRVERLLKEWVETVFEEPYLLPVYFPERVVDGEPIVEEGEQPEENTAEEENQAAPCRKKLRKASRALRRLGVDPFEESFRLASTLTTRRQSSSPNGDMERDPTTQIGRGSGLYKRKNTAMRLEFEEEDENVNPDDPNGDQTYRLSKLPRRESHSFSDSDTEYSQRGSKTKVRKSQQKKYDGRRFWSNEEKQAIIEGIRVFGLSKWAEIKEEYKVLFDLRTSGQIKDCYRTMKKNGEIPEALLTQNIQEDNQEV